MRWINPLWWIQRAREREAMELAAIAADRWRFFRQNIHLREDVSLTETVGMFLEPMMVNAQMRYPRMVKRDRTVAIGAILVGIGSTRDPEVDPMQLQAIFDALTKREVP